MRGSSYFTWLWNFASRKSTVGFRDSSLKTCQSQFSKYFDCQVSDVARTDAKMNKQCVSGGAYGKICTWFYKEDEFNKTESTLAKKRCIPFLSGCGNWIGMFQSLKREKTKPSHLPTCQGWYDRIMLSNRKCHRRIQWQIFNIHGQSQRQKSHLFLQQWAKFYLTGSIWIHPHATVSLQKWIRLYLHSPQQYPVDLLWPSYFIYVTNKSTAL